MAKQYISQIVDLEGVLYDIKDTDARQMIADLGDALYWVGVTTTVLTDGATTNPIVISGESVTANVGAMAQYNGEEFVWNGSAWQSIGANNFGALAFADTTDVTGVAAAQTFTGTEATINSSGNVTAEGSVSLSGGTPQTVVTGIGDATTTNIKEFDDAGSVTAGSAASFSQGTDTLTMTVENEVLRINFSQGTDSFTANTPTVVSLPTSKETAVVTGQGAPTTASVQVPDTATFTGSSVGVNVSGTYTPEGSNSTSNVTGTGAPHTV